LEEFRINSWSGALKKIFGDAEVVFEGINEIAVSL
jgi:hypothetical protein